MGGRNLDDLKKLGDKMEVVSRHLKKLLVHSHLIQAVSNVWHQEEDPNKPSEATG